MARRTASEPAPFRPPEVRTEIANNSGCGGGKSMVLSAQEKDRLRIERGRLKAARKALDYAIEVIDNQLNTG